jgi:hypothetical protein
MRLCPCLCQCLRRCHCLRGVMRLCDCIGVAPLFVSLSLKSMFEVSETIEW